MKKIILILGAIICFLNANSCQANYPDLYKIDKENLFLTASRLKEYCYNNDKNACVCFDEYIKYCDEKCSKKDGIYCMVIATTFGYKDEHYLDYLKKSCDGDYSNGCYVYAGYLELDYVNTKNKNSKKESIYYYNKACKTGDKKACRSLINLK